MVETKHRDRWPFIGKTDHNVGGLMVYHTSIHDNSLLRTCLHIKKASLLTVFQLFCPIKGQALYFGKDF